MKTVFTDSFNMFRKAIWNRIKTQTARSGRIYIYGTAYHVS